MQIRPQIRPLVAVIACRRDVEGHPAHIVTDKYLTALRAYGLDPVVLPVWEDVDVERAKRLLSHFDGLMLTGSPTNVHPSRYREECAPENERADTDRDAVALALIPAVLERGLPLLAICRGFQELNVAFGGSLYQAVQNQPGKFDHREPKGKTQQQYVPTHELAIKPGGVLAGLYPEHGARVNSLHQQGIDRLGNGLTVEGVAPDSLIEAVSVSDAKTFTLGVQWHPEWQPTEHPLYDAIFKGFAEACLSAR
ncbi:gamma-glutamyl-gamma-aminobutyrate hydrolase family protein [Vreelandella subglaciescola]|jgi:putative glutamine amidotransferase|uniref:gamma-glutamyl-gamma-aminobutyrate hydrolase n=1 Tax=Vreelandella subglaciescola TaxID=29571 RepID=A0A1M7FSQ6_9GAMM|nr:gamma-glutamyl-gamma-aminobutyrate hydrolase family protein [Halomonas subglaciescola]SHM07162.1 gamma-glutamyl-gamma-aminobutyrate hydrolase [Halomonas subglaciescola]